MPKKKTTKIPKTVEVPRREEDTGGHDWLQKKLWGSESLAPPRSKEEKAARERARKQEQGEKRAAKTALASGPSNLLPQPTANPSDMIDKLPAVADIDSDVHFTIDPESPLLTTDVYIPPQTPLVNTPTPNHSTVHSSIEPAISIHTIISTNSIRAPRDLSSLRSSNPHPWSQLRRRNRRVLPNRCNSHSNLTSTSIHVIDYVTPVPTPEQAPAPHTPLEPDSYFKLNLPSLYDSLPHDMIRNHTIDIITSAIPYSHKCDISIFETLWGSIHEPSSRRAFEILVHMPVEPKAFLQILWIIAYPDGPNGRPSVFSPYLVQTVRCFLTNWILAS